MRTENIKIIIIDDDPFAMTMTGETIKRIVSEEQTISFSSAAAALKYLRTETGLPTEDNSRPGLIISDLHMPGIDGFMFLADYCEFKKKNPGSTGL
jgi:CheY-like chemotaxis protein